MAQDHYRMVAKASPSGRPARRVDRRSAVLDAATSLFAQRGFAGVSLQEIAHEARTYKTTVLYHFPTKEALHEAVLDEALGRMAEVMREFLSGPFSRERVAYLLDQMHAFFVGHQEMARLLERELLESADPEAFLRRFVEPIYAPAVDALAQAADHGIIRQIDPAMFIHDIHVQLVSYFCHRPLLERLMGEDPFSIEALIHRRNYLVDQIFRHLDLEEDGRAERGRVNQAAGGRS